MTGHLVKPSKEILFISGVSRRTCHTAAVRGRRAAASAGGVVVLWEIWITLSWTTFGQDWCLLGFTLIYLGRRQLVFLKSAKIKTHAKVEAILVVCSEAFDQWLTFCDYWYGNDGARLERVNRIDEICLDLDINDIPNGVASLQILDWILVLDKSRDAQVQTTKYTTGLETPKLWSETNKMLLYKGLNLGAFGQHKVLRQGAIKVGISLAEFGLLEDLRWEWLPSF